MSQWPPTMERFWAYVNKDGPVPKCRPDLGPCWVWTGELRDGYGRFWTQGRTHQAHRYLYERKIRPLGNLIPDHLCRNRACVRLSHLEPVTNKENILRGTGAPARHAKQTHCKHGHPFSGKNLRISKRGHRLCVLCAHEQDKRHADREKAREGKS